MDRSLNRLSLALVAALGATALPALPAEADNGFVYSGAFYDDRYSDTSFNIDAIQPFGPVTARFAPYLEAALNLDSQTFSTAIPDILTDNYALGAFGAQYPTPGGLRAFAQVGATARLGAVSLKEPGADFRSGVELSRNWKGGPRGLASYGNYYGSAEYTSRYRDGVLVNQLEEGRTFRYGRQAVDLYARALLSAGSHGYYYTNLAEGGLGLRFHSPNVTRVTLSVEESVGAYLFSENRPATQSDAYHDFRINLSYAVPF